MAGGVRWIGWGAASTIALAAGLAVAAVQVVGPPEPRRAAAAKRAVPAPHRPTKPAPPRTAAAKPAVADEVFVIKRVLDVPEPMRIGAWYWDDAGVPAGRIVITADLEAGTLSVFRGGYEIGTAAILYGLDDKPTPTGLFSITQKDAHHVSNIYDAPMPYMMRLTSDGISIHGSQVASGWATHGCIGVPVPFAAKLFAQAKLGDPVLVTNGGLRVAAGGQPSSAVSPAPAAAASSATAT